MRASVLLVAGALVVAAPSAAVGLPQGTRVSTYKGGLHWPVDMDWVPGSKRIFYTEKNTGKIRVLVRRHLRSRACANLA